MKTKEFIKKVEEMGYSVSNDDVVIGVHSERRLLMYVYKGVINAIYTFCGDGISYDLFDLGVEYAKTPLKEREEPKKYYLKARGYAGMNSYFNYFLDGKGWFVGSNSDTSICRTQFTQEEIDNNPYSDIVKTFEKVEVEVEEL